MNSLLALGVAEGATTTSLLDGSVKTLITNTAGQIVPTVLDIAMIVVPVGIAVWAVGFGIKKGIGFLQKKASKAL